MTRGRKICFAGCTLLAGGALAAVCWPGEKEPVYHGKTLSQRIDLSENQDAVVSSGAVRAVKQIGTDALPFLCEGFRHAGGIRTYRAVKTLDAWFESANVKFRPGRSRDERIHRTIRGFAILQEQAAEAIPQLVELARGQEDVQRELAVLGLGAIGHSAAPAYCALLLDTNAAIRFYAVQNAYCFGTNMALLTPLKAALNDPDPAIRSAAQEVLSPGGSGIVILP